MRSHPSNLVFSPFSLHMTLAMLTSGASDNSTTQKELLDALGRSRNIQALEGRYRSLLEEYKDLNETFLFGNRLWTTKQYFDSLKPEFLHHLKEVFESEFTVLGAKPVEQVNQWVSDGTRGKISKLYENLPADLVLLLTNVIYFKDAWTVPFNNLSAEESAKFKPLFNLVEGSQVTEGVRLMTRTSYEFGHKKIEFEGIKGKQFVLVSIPYKYDFGSRFDMLILMPTDQPGDIRILEDLIKRNANSIGTENVFDRLDMEMGTHNSGSGEIRLVMPEFKVDGDLMVNHILKKMGVSGIFNRGEFDRISPIPLMVSEIKQKAIIEVDKEGTVGAVATGIDLVPLSGAFLEPEDVFINKPFLFVIRDKDMKVPLFVGKILDPRR